MEEAMDEDPDGVLSSDVEMISNVNKKRPCKSSSESEYGGGRRRKAKLKTKQQRVEGTSQRVRVPVKQFIDISITNTGQEPNHETLVHTAKSQINQKTIIILELEENQDRFFNDTVTVYKLMEASPIGKVGILESRRDLRRKIMVIQIKDNERLDEIKSMKSLGNYKISIYQPKSIEFRSGVIGPTGVETQTNDIEDNLKSTKYPNCKVTRIMKGNGQKAIPTMYIRISFPQAEYPRDGKVRLFYELFELKPFVEKPWQCFRCQSFGHSAKFCTRKVKCVICAGDHGYKECTNKADPDKVKCTNCGQKHTASYGGCNFIREEKSRQLLRVQENISYREALIKFNDRKKETSVENKHHQSRQEYNVKTKVVPVVEEWRANVSTQTDFNNDEISKQKIEDFIQEKIHSLLAEKLQECLMEILSSTERTESSTVKKGDIVSKVIKAHLFGKEVGDTMSQCKEVATASGRKPRAIKSRSKQ